MSFITFVIGVGIGVIAQRALDITTKVAQTWAAFQAWRKYRKP